MPAPAFRPYRVIVGVPLALVLVALALLTGEALFFSAPSDGFDVSRVALQIGLLCLGCCGWAAALGLCRLHRTRRLRQRAGNSRETLLAIFTAEQQKLPYWLLGIGLPMVLAAASLVLLFALLWIGDDKFLLFAGIALLLLTIGLWYLWQVFRAMRASLGAVAKPVTGRRVARADSPMLWQLVDEVTETTGMRAPDTVILGFDSGLFVTEGALALTDDPHGESTRVTGRTLYLSLPYLAYLTRAEARAVIGHELAHFSGADTTFSLGLAPFYETAWRSLYLVRKRDRDDTESDGSWIFAPLVRTVLQHFLATFDLAVQQFSRERELAADRAGALAAGPQALASALVCITTLANIIERVLFEFAVTGGRSQHAEGLLAQVFATVRAADDKDIDPRQHLEQSQPHPYDSHPPTLQRLHALEVNVEETLLAYATRREPSGLLAELDRLDLPTSAAPTSATAAVAKTPTSLSESLERHHSAVTQRAADEEIAQLRTQLLPAVPDLVVRERGVLAPAIQAALAALFGSMLVNQIRYFDEEFAGFIFVAAPLCLLGFALFGGLLALHINRRRHPALTLTAQGLRLDTPLPPGEETHGLHSQPLLLPWANLARVESERRYGTQRLNLHLHAVPESLKSDWRRGIGVARKPARICIRGNALRLPGSADLIDTMTRYADHTAVRARLAQLGG